MNAKRSISDEENERHKRILSLLLKQDGNKQCADCKTRNPTWASVNLGVFVCLTCSGIHRSLGVHISQVRSCNLDTWLPRQVEFMKVMGNLKGNRYWEAQLPDHFKRPPGGEPNPELASFIRSKYAERRYAASDAPPPTIDNWSNHPYAGAATAAPAAAAPSRAAAPAPAAVGAAAAAPALRSPALTAAPKQQQQQQRRPPQQAAAQAQVKLQQPPPPAVDLLGVEADPVPVPPSGSGGGAAAAAPSAAGADPFDDWHEFTAAAPPSQTSTASAPSDPFANLAGHDLIGSMSKVSVSSAPAPAHQAAAAPAAPANGSSGGGAAPRVPPAAARAANKSAEDILKLFDQPQQTIGAFGAMQQPRGPAAAPFAQPGSAQNVVAFIHQQTMHQHHQQQLPPMMQYAPNPLVPPVGMNAAMGGVGGMGVPLGQQQQQQQQTQQQHAATFNFPTGL